MKRFLAPAIVFLSALAYGADVPKFLAEQLTPGAIINGEVIVVVPPPELDKYVAKVEDAARKDTEWFREYSKNAKSGVPLPYHEKLGLTKEEYDEYLKLWGKREFKPLQAVKIQLKNSDDKWSIAVSGQGQSISLLRYDAKTDTFNSPNGPMTRLDDVSADANSTLGAWSGREWRFEETTGLGTTKENIAIGQTADKKYGLVVYRLQEVSSLGTKLADQGVVIRYLMSAVNSTAKTAEKPADKPAPKPAPKPKKK